MYTQGRVLEEPEVAEGRMRISEMADAALRQTYDDVVLLLEYGIAARDCGRFSGLPHGLVRSLAVERNINIQSPGRTPTSVTFAFMTPARHIWLSTYLMLLEPRIGSIQPGTVTASDILDALIGARLAASGTDCELGGRYLICATNLFLAGDLHLAVCRHCGTHYAKSRVKPLARGKTAERNASCPLCKTMYRNGAPAPADPASDRTASVALTSAEAPRWTSETLPAHLYAGTAPPTR